jgi:hypothetical protein
MKIRNILPEFKIAGQQDPKDAADYKEKMKTLQQIKNNPSMRDPETQATIAKRKEELRKWAEKNLHKEEISYGCTSISLMMFVDVILLLLIYFTLFE